MVGEVTPTVPQSTAGTLLSNLSLATLTSGKFKTPTEGFDHHIAEETLTLTFNHLLGLVLGLIITILGHNNSSSSLSVSSIDLRRRHNSSHLLIKISKLIDHHSHIIILTNSLDRGSSSRGSLGQGLRRTWNIEIGSMRNPGLLLNGVYCLFLCNLCIYYEFDEYYYLNGITITNNSCGLDKNYVELLRYKMNFCSGFMAICI